MARSVVLFTLYLFAINSFIENVAAGDYPQGFRPEHISQRLKKKEIYTGSTGLATPKKSLDQLPKSFDWCNRDGTSYCTSSWNQHIPQYCGSCYVHGALAQANDRLKVLLGAHNDLLLARQVILNCGPHYGLGEGCNGGDAYDIFEYMHRYGLPDESCQNYVAKSSATCNAEAQCQNCMPVGEDLKVTHCWAVPKPILYYVTEYGRLSGEEAIMSEIEAGGPVTCGFASVDDFDYNYKGGIYWDKTNASNVNHDVEVVGWGEENGVKFWKARNSWGTYWGENSFFRIVRGINNMQFESDCVFARFDIKPVEKVLNGELTGSMYGLVDKHLVQSKPSANELFLADSTLVKTVTEDIKSTIKDKESGQTSYVHESSKTQVTETESQPQPPSNDSNQFIPPIAQQFMKQGMEYADKFSKLNHNENSTDGLSSNSFLPKASESSDSSKSEFDGSKVSTSEWSELARNYKSLVEQYASAYKSAYEKGVKDFQSSLSTVNDPANPEPLQTTSLFDKSPSHSASNPSGGFDYGSFLPKGTGQDFVSKYGNQGDAFKSEQDDYAKKFTGGKKTPGDEFYGSFRGKTTKGSHDSHPSKSQDQSSGGFDYNKFLKGAPGASDYTSQGKHSKGASSGGGSGSFDYSKYMKGSGGNGDYSKFLQGGKGNKGGDFSNFIPKFNGQGQGFIPQSLFDSSANKADSSFSSYKSMVSDYAASYEQAAKNGITKFSNEAQAKYMNFVNGQPNKFPYQPASLFDKSQANPGGFDYSSFVKNGKGSSPYDYTQPMKDQADLNSYDYSKFLKGNGNGNGFDKFIPSKYAGANQYGKYTGSSLNEIKPEESKNEPVEEVPAEDKAYTLKKVVQDKKEAWISNDKLDVNVESTVKSTKTIQHEPSQNNNNNQNPNDFIPDIAKGFMNKFIPKDQAKGANGPNPSESDSPKPNVLAEVGQGNIQNGDNSGLSPVLFLLGVGTLFGAVFAYNLYKKRQSYEQL